MFLTPSARFPLNTMAYGIGVGGLPLNMACCKNGDRGLARLGLLKVKGSFWLPFGGLGR